MMELKPASVFEAFSEINRVPRPSKREDKMMEYLLEVGRSLGLETQRDEIGNVVIRKPATPGMEDRPILVLQSHMDMVCEKNNDVEFDFDNDAIQAYVDGDWMKAKGTTLGADDGIGCKNIKDGFGLHHMRERVNMLGGSINCWSEKGFVLDVTLPLNRTPKGEKQL